jgi:hypothetical protein
MTTRFAQLALAVLPLILAAAPALAVELSGTIVSSTGMLPAGIEVMAQGSEPGHIVGKVEGRRYRIEVPDAGLAVLQLRAPGWDAAKKPVFDPKNPGRLDMLMYPARVPEPALAAELIEMGKQDQAIRENIGSGKPDPAFAKRWQEEDLARERRLGAIIDAKGWPAISMVGHEAAGSAWLIAQHASPAFLKRCLPLMQAAAGKLEISPQQLALSVDRDRMYDGKPQIYGSQLRSGKDGKLELYPIEDREHVDVRRAAMEMEPLADYLARFGDLGKQ